MRFKQFLIEYDQQIAVKDIDIGNRPLKPDPNRFSPNAKAGHFSKVTPTKDAHIVRKQSHSPDIVDKDGYWPYVAALVDSGIAKENPYFPRLYAVKRYHNENGDLVYRADIETLESLDNIEYEILAAYVEKISNKKFDLSYKPYLTKGDNRYNIEYILDEFIESLIRNPRNLTSDPLLKQAAQFIAKFKKDYIIDIHGNNYMFRRGQYGIQLVFTDPLANKIKQ